MSRILVTGALGQIGSELVISLQEIYGKNNIIISDIKDNNLFVEKDDIFEKLDILNAADIEIIIKKYNIDKIYHLAAILSAIGEKNPQLCYNVNMNGLYNILEASRKLQIKQIICPSSIAVFGDYIEKDMTKQNNILMPNTIYGVTKASGELLCRYYKKKYNIDIRSIRYPGLISSKTMPGGGTTDYAVQIYYDAILYKKYQSFLSKDTKLPMMYMKDAIKGTINLANADIYDVKETCNYNFAAINVTPNDIYSSIKKYIPEFEISYKIDYRQDIADSWPNSIDDENSQIEWGWKADYDLDKMTKDMIEELRIKLNKEK